MISRANIAVKVLLVAFLLHAVAFPDLEQYQGKGMGWRLVLYPLTAAIVPVVPSAVEAAANSSGVSPGRGENRRSTALWTMRP